MLLIETNIRPSDISGIGLFAAEPIRKDTTVWRYNPDIDMLLSRDQLQRLSCPALKQVRNYAFLDIKYQKYMLCGDDARFFNHAPEPNCDDSQVDVTIASRDIQVGEELTVDYSSFDGNLRDLSEVSFKPDLGLVHGLAGAAREVVAVK